MLLVRVLRGGPRIDAFWIALIGSAAGFYSSIPWEQIGHLGGVENREKMFGFFFTGMLIYDPFTIYFRAILLGFAVLFTIFTKLSGIPDREDAPDFYSLVFGATIVVMYCRFCTRKRVTMDRDGWDAPSHDELRMIDYIRQAPDIRDVILSGGDPLTLPISKLRWFVEQLAAIDHVDVIRVGTRVPVTLPQRLFDSELIDLLMAAEKIWIQTHFNHPREITPDASRACRALVNAGMPVSNHAVLLKGINDSLPTMDHHSGGIWYYIPAVLVGFFPWSIFAIPTALDLTRRCREKASWQRGAKFLASWIIVWVGFFSLASTKLPNYVLPAYPALALATGCLIARWIRQDAVRPLMPRLSFGSLIAVGCVIVIGATVMAHRSSSGVALLERLGATPELVGDLSLIGLLGILLVAGGAISMWPP